MTKAVGVWVDDARATIIWIGDDQVRVEHIESGVGRAGAPRRPQNLASGGRMGQRQHQHMRMFLGRVIDIE